MKKLLIGLLALTLLTGCIPQCVDTSPTGQDDTTELYVDAAKLRMQVPNHMHMDVRKKPNSEPRIYILMGERYYQHGELNPMIRLTIEHKEYEDYMAENWDAPYYPLENACEAEAPLLGEPFRCNGDEYYTTMKMGDYGFNKKYYIERDDNDWHQIEVWVNLKTDDFKERIEGLDYEGFKAEAQKLDFTDEQKRRIQMADNMLKTLQFK